MLLIRGKEDDGINLEKTEYTPVSKYSPPNISKYTSVEIEELLLNKVQL